MKGPVAMTHKQKGDLRVPFLCVKTPGRLLGGALAGLDDLVAPDALGAHANALGLALDYDPDGIWETITLDKKGKDGRVRFVLIKDIGKPMIREVGKRSFLKAMREL